MQEYEHTGWEYNGTISDFMHLIRWALVFQELAGEDNEEILDIIRDRGRLQEYALSRGMTLRAITDEMLVVAAATTEMLDGMEKTARQEDDND